MPGGTREIMRAGDMPRIASLNRVYLIPAAAESDGTPVAIRSNLFYSAQDGGVLEDRVGAVESSITTSTFYAVSWAALSAKTGQFDGQGAIVIEDDTGTHQDATASGYNGPTVPNAGFYTWNSGISRWDWISQSASDNALENADLRYRPGDVPWVFDLGITSPATTSLGRVVLANEATTVSSESFVAIEETTSLEFRVSYFRDTNPADPDNDAVQVKVLFYDSGKNLIESRTLVTHLGLLVADGRQEVFRVITWDSSIYGAEAVIPPSGTVYVRPLIEFYGIDHSTGADLLMVCAAPKWAEEAGRLRAESLYTPSLDFEFNEDWIPDFSVARTIFVSQGGDNGNNGESLRSAVRSIEAARDLVEASEDPTSIVVYPGRYETSGHIDVSDNCTEIVGIMGQRSVVVAPTAGNEGKNVFRGGSGFMLRNMSAQGFQVDDFDNPTEGFLMSFRPDAVIYRALYMDHCVNYRALPATLMPPPLDPENGNPSMSKGPGLVLADGNVVSGYSPFAQIMVEASTNSSPNGMGCVVKGEAFVNLINAVMLWSHKHVMALDGGTALLNNCSTQMGDYTLWSEGFRNEVRLASVVGAIGKFSSDAATVEAARTTLINAAVAAAPGADATSTERDAGILVDAIRYDMIGGTTESIKIFTRGLFPHGAFVSSTTAPFVASFNAMKTAINGLGISAGSKTMAEALIDAIVATVNAPVFQKVPSIIRANQIQFELPFGGVNARAFARPARAVRDTVVQKRLGTVQYSGVDGRGEQFFSGGASVEPVSGQFKGPPVARTIQPFATRAALISGGQQ